MTAIKYAQARILGKSFLLTIYQLDKGDHHPMSAKVYQKRSWMNGSHSKEKASNLLQPTDSCRFLQFHILN